MNAALLVIYATIVLDAVGISLLNPILPRLLQQLTATSLADAALYGGALTALYAAVQFLASPLLGNLSDRYGRRPVLIGSLVASAGNYAVMALARSVGWLFASQALAGLFGATIGTAGAYLADVTPAADRPRRFGWIGASFGIGYIIGPLIGGELSRHGVRAPIVGAAVAAALNVLFALVYVRETLAPGLRRRFTLRRANPVGAWRQMRRDPILLRLLLVVLLLQFVGQMLPATWPYYSAEKYGWSPRLVGYTIGLFGVMNIAFQGLLLGRIVRSLGGGRTARYAMLLTIVGYIGLACAPSGAAVIAWFLPTALGFLANPALSGLMSARAAADAQGELQGAVASAYSFASVVAPLSMTALFSYFSAPAAPVYFPGAPYLVGAAVTALAVALGARALRAPASANG